MDFPCLISRAGATKQDRVRRGIGGAPGAVEAKRTKLRRFVLRSLCLQHRAFFTAFISSCAVVTGLAASRCTRGSVAGQVRVRVGGLCAGRAESFHCADVLLLIWRLDGNPFLSFIVHCLLLFSSLRDGFNIVDRFSKDGNKRYHLNFKATCKPAFCLPI